MTLVLPGNSLALKVMCAYPKVIFKADTMDRAYRQISEGRNHAVKLSLSQRFNKNASA